MRGCSALWPLTPERCSPDAADARSALAGRMASEPPVNVASPVAPYWIGAPVPRKEDEALLSGRARFIDDLAPVPGLKHAAILRSPHPHARLTGIDVHRAAGLPGVAGVVTGAELKDLAGPIPSVVKAPVPYYPFAIAK